jgi:hypothetical protein
VAITGPFTQSRLVRVEFGGRNDLQASDVTIFRYKNTSFGELQHSTTLVHRDLESISYTAMLENWRAGHFYLKKG